MTGPPVTLFRLIAIDNRLGLEMIRNPFNGQVNF
jgi:hypothetical protein